MSYISLIFVASFYGLPYYSSDIKKNATLISSSTRHQNSDSTIIDYDAVPFEAELEKSCYPQKISPKDSIVETEFDIEKFRKKTPNICKTKKAINTNDEIKQKWFKLLRDGSVHLTEEFLQQATEINCSIHGIFSTVKFQLLYKTLEYTNKLSHIQRFQHLVKVSIDNSLSLKSCYQTSNRMIIMSCS
jgi:hypothetical protein